MLLARLSPRRDSQSASRSLVPALRPAARCHRSARSPRVEWLEDRTLLSGWAFGFGPAGIQGTGGAVTDVATDSADSVYITGRFSGTVDFDAGAGVVNLTSVGGSDVFVAKYSPSGAFLWARRAGGPNGSCCLDYDRANAVTTDAAGNVYVAGAFAETADFGPFTVTSAGSLDAFVTKLDAAGNFLWVRTVGGSGADGAKDVAVDATGTVYATGSFQGSVDFNPDPIATHILTSAGGNDVFVWTLSADSNLIWARRAGSTDGEVAADISVDATGNAYISGVFRATADFGSFTLTAPAGSADGYVAMLDSSGTFVWARVIGQRVTSCGWPRVARDNSGDLYVNGSFLGTVDFGGVTLTSVNGSDGSPSDDFFAAKLDAATGNLIWVRQLGGPGTDCGGRIAVDSTGNVYGAITGSGTAFDFDPSAATAFLTGLAVLKLDSFGNFVWVRRIDAAAVALDSASRVISSGGFSGPVLDVDVGSSIATLTMPSNYGYIFVAATEQIVPTSPALARLNDSPDPVPKKGGALTLTADAIRVVAGGSNVASVSFYRDANANGTLQVGTDTLLGTDTNGSNGWSLATTAPNTNGIYTYFAQAKDSSNVAGNVVSARNRVGPGGPVAAMVVTRDSGPAAIDRVIASHFANEREERFDLLSRLHLSRDLLNQLRHARRR